MNNLKESIRTLSPFYFALPMSTGILAISTFTLNYTGIAEFFFFINHIELVALGALLSYRLIFFFEDFIKDLSSHKKGAGFLTMVVALCVFGSANVILRDNYNLAAALWVIALCVWMILIYSFLVFISVKKDKPLLEDGINGSWLLMIVSVQAISILGNLIAPYFGVDSAVTLFVTIGFYLLGMLFYLIIIAFIFYRIVFLPMKPADFVPSFWINMGAAAISTLAGAILVKSMNGVAIFHSFIPIIQVLTILFWMGGTWWIPAVGFLELWKRRNIEVKYNPGYWSLVFPLGVYTFCTWQLAEVMDLSFLKIIPEYFIYIAWASWLITFWKMGQKNYLLFKRN